MKLTAIFVAFATLTSSALAAPKPQDDSEYNVLSLRIKSLEPSLNGLPIGKSYDLGLVASKNVTAWEFTTYPGAHDGTYSTNVAYIKIIERLVLKGLPGLEQLATVMGEPIKDANVLWNDWTISEEGLLGYEGVEGRWIAFPKAGGEWVVYLSDGSVITTADYMPVEVEVVEVE